MAGDAINVNTILYRLYVRAPGLPPYAFTGRIVGDERATFSDVIGVKVDAANRLLLGHKGGIAIFDPQGVLKSTVTASEPSAFFVDELGRIVFARQASLLAEKGATTVITVPQVAPKPPRPVDEIPSMVALSTGQLLIVDKKEKNIIRVGSNGSYIGTFITDINTERLAISRLDDVAILDKDSKSVTIADRDGKVLTKVLPKGPNYQFERSCRSGVRPTRAPLRARSRQGIGLCLRPEEQADHDVHCCGKEPGRVRQGEVVRPRRGGSYVHLRRARQAHSGLSMRAQSTRLLGRHRLPGVVIGRSRTGLRTVGSAVERPVADGTGTRVL